MLSKLLTSFSRFLLFKLSKKRKTVINNKQDNPYQNLRKNQIARFIITTLTAFLFTINFTGIGLFFAQPALAAANLTIEPLTWDFIGLDSNNVNVGPNVFIIGARVCNVGTSAATNLNIQFNAGASSAISLQFPAFQTINKTTVTGIPQLVSLPSGPPPPSKNKINYTPSNCFDGYFNIKVARNSSSYNQTLPYTISAFADSTATVSTPAGRQLYVEKLISQARNAVLSFTNLTTGSNTVYVGGTYDFELRGKTATAYPQLTLTSDFPNIIFQLLRVKTSYETPTGAVNSTVYADACGWIADPSFIGYHESSSACNGVTYPKQYGDGSDTDAKVGNNVTTVYTIKVLATPSGSTAPIVNPVPVSHLILDYSGSSFHYNADNGTGLGLSYITVLDAPDLRITKTAPAGPFTVGTNFNYTLNVQNLSTSTATTGTTTVQDNLPPGMQFQSFTGAGWTCRNALGNTCAVGDQGTLTFSTASIAANTTSTIALTVKPTVSGTNIPNTATVSTPNDKDTTNNTSTVNINVNPAPDLTITKTGPVSVGQGQTGVTYTLALQNIGTVATSGQITVTDTLPSGLTPNATKITSDNAANWTCSTSGQVVSCTTNSTFTAGATLPSILITADVPANATAGVVTNTATVSGGSDGNSSNNTSNLPIQIGSSPDLTISKTSTPASFTKGGTATYNLTVTNIGNQATNGATITVTDILPTGITATSASFTNNTWNCTASGQTVTCTNTVNLVAGTGTSTFGIPVNISAGAAGNSFVNQAIVSVPGDGNSNNNSTTLTTGTGPDVTILKTASGSFSNGSTTAKYAITVTNIGGTTTTGAITFNDTITDAKVAYSSFTGPVGWTCTGSAQTFSCNNPSPNLAPGASATITVSVTVSSGVAQTVPNTVTIDATNNGGDTNTTNNSSSTTTGSGLEPDLIASKILTRSGTNGTYTITVTNSSGATDVTASNATVTMTDTLPTGVTVSSISVPASTWSCSQTGTPVVVTCTIKQQVSIGGNFPAITLNVANLPTSGSFTNTGNVAYSTHQLNTSNDTFSLTTTIPTIQDLTINKIGPTTLAQGQSGTYTLKVTNVGQTATTAGIFYVTDTLPAGMTATSASGTGWTCSIPSASQVSCNRSDSLAANNSYPDIIVAVQVASNATLGARTNTAQVTGTNVFPTTSPTTAGGETNLANNTSSVNLTITGVPDLTITKGDNGPFTQGGTGTYNLTVTNSGSVATSGLITVTDTLPTGITYNTTSSVGWTCSASGQIVTCTSNTVINAGSSSSLNLQVNISSNAPSSVINNVQVSGGGESNSSNNTATKTTTVNGVVDLTIVKSHTPTNFTQGGTGNYTLSVVNIGSVATSGTVTVTDTLPSGLTPTSANGTNWTCTITGQAVSCTTTDVLNGGNTAYPDITIGVNVSNTATTTTNTATVFGGGDSNSSNNSANDFTTIVAPTATPDLSITKTHTGNFDQGGTGSYTITVSNIGTVAVPNTTVVTVTDPLPPDLSRIAPTASGTGWNCSNTGNSTTGYTVTCTRSDGLGAGASYPAITLNVGVSNNPRNELFNSASVSLPGTENNITNNAINDTTYINQTDLSITKTPPASLSPGQTGAVYTLSVVNVGAKPTDGTTVTVTDTLPTGLIPTAASGTGWTCNISGQTVTCTRTSVLAANGAAYPDITLTVNVAASPPSYIVNTASVSGGGDLNTGNNDGLVGVATGTDLAMTKTHTGTFIKGSTGVFNLLVTNVGGSATSSPVTVTDTLVTGFTPTAASGTGWSCSISGQTVTCTNNVSLAAGQSYSPINITVNISAAAPNTLTNTASVSGGGDVKTANNNGTDTIYFGPDITIVKTHVGTFTAGQPGTYNLTVSNLGGSASSGTVTVTDTLPSGFTATAASGTGWTCSPSTGTAISCTRGDSLGAGASYPVIAVTVSVPASPNPSVTNTANVSGGSDVNLNNNSSDDVVTFSTAPKLLLVKRITAITSAGTTTQLTGFDDNTNTSDPTYLDDNDPKWPSPNTDYLRGKINGGFVKNGDVLEYTVYFLSKGGSAAKNVMICDLVPANTTFLATGFDADAIANDGVATGPYGMALGWSSSSVPTSPTFKLTNAADSDRGEFFPAGSTPSTTCSAANSNGAIVVKVGGAAGIPQATGSGIPADSYGFIRFRATVK